MSRAAAEMEKGSRLFATGFEGIKRYNGQGVALMKRCVKEILLAIFLGVVLPWVAFGITAEFALPEVTEPETTTPSAPAATLPVLLTDGSLEYMDLTEYLTGVLLCEMPASFETQAKMAQAVVARTYAMRTVLKGIKHDPAAVCADSGCCQGFRSVQSYLNDGGTQEAVEQAKLAVTLTQGQVLLYDDQLIEATYFSCSGGMTEDAVAVWGSDIPYLQAVSSPGEENASHYTDTQTFSAEQFQQLLGVSLSGNPAQWFGSVTYTDGGGVETMVIGEAVYKGTTLRSLLSLRSTAFTVEAQKDSITITTRGFGHRVGMSQYGAQAMALLGNEYTDILAHYYPGTTIDKADDLG